MTFEEFQEKCVQNKEKVDKYSKYLTFVLICTIAFVVFYFGPQTGCLWGLCIFGFIALGATLTSNTTDDRIYSNYPSMLSIVPIAIFTVYYIQKFGIISENLIIYLIGCFFIWLALYITHCLSVIFLDCTFFANPKLSYTARIVKTEHVTKRSKNSTSHYYYAYFYDYTNTLIYGQISRKEYTYWKKGDVIKTILQPRIDEVTTKEIKRLHKFQGKTDMEIIQENHERDVALFGKSQEEMDAEEGKSKNISYKWIFYWVLGIAALILTFSKGKIDSIFESTTYNLIMIITAIAVAIFVTFKEKARIKTQYTIQDMDLWRDYLIPRISFYLVSVYLLLASILLVIFG